MARRPHPLQLLVQELRALGATANAVVADLSDLDRLPQVTDRVREVVGDLDVLYYGAAAKGFLPAVDLTHQRMHDLMRLGVYGRWR